MRAETITYQIPKNSPTGTVTGNYYLKSRKIIPQEFLAGNGEASVQSLPAPLPFQACNRGLSCNHGFSCNQGCLGYLGFFVPKRYTGC